MRIGILPRRNTKLFLFILNSQFAPYLRVLRTTADDTKMWHWFFLVSFCSNTSKTIEIYLSLFFRYLKRVEDAVNEAKRLSKGN